jgi:hypothetical protein
MAKFYQKLIHVNGYRITFDTKILTDLDFRKYNVIVRNIYGEDVFTTIFQLYRGGQFYLRKKPSTWSKAIILRTIGFCAVLR